MTAEQREREHALLSASGAEKWLNCPPSARLEETLPDSNSGYAAEGQLAHKIAELKLFKYFNPMGPKAYKDKMAELEADPLYAPEMQRHTDEYVEYIKGVAMSYPTNPLVFIEKRVDYSHIAPEGFGTDDCLLIHGHDLHIFDLKYGQGVPVSVENNSQLKLYALGTLQHFGMFYDLRNITLHIIQPRLEFSGSWLTSRDELMAWGESIKLIAGKAFAGEGEYQQGPWCRFCRAKNLCRARAEFQLALAPEYEMKKPPLLTDQEVGEALLKAQQLAKWAADLEEYAEAQLLAGGEIPHWKLVEGRSTRQFTDQDAAFTKLIKEGTDEALLYERKPITLTAVEKLFKKKEFESLLSDYIIKPPGKPTLAPETDKRKPITAKTTAAEDFSQPA